VPIMASLKGGRHSVWQWGNECDRIPGKETSLQSNATIVISDPSVPAVVVHHRAYLQMIMLQTALCQSSISQSAAAVLLSLAILLILSRTGSEPLSPGTELQRHHHCVVV